MAISAMKFQAETLRSLVYSSIDSTYMGVGTAISHPARQIYVTNLTDAALVFSFDGVDDHFVLASYAYMFNDVTANQTGPTGWFIAEGTRLYVKHLGIAPTLGSVYLSYFYGSLT